MSQGERTEALVVDPCTSQDTVARVACEVENLLGVARDTLDTVRRRMLILQLHRKL